MRTQKTWFITGASRGFGFEIAKAALEAGDRVVGTVRSNTSVLAEALDDHPNLFVVKMDVTQETEVKEAVQLAIDYFGRLDVMVNNAGYGIVGGIEEVSDVEARRQYDTNVFGLLNVLRSTLPFLRKERAGHIINLSSLFAFDPLPGWGLYGSTKNAVEGISIGLSKELAPFGIKVSAIEAGLFRTGFTSRESYVVAHHAISDYTDTPVDYMRKGTDAYHGNQPGNPSKLASVVVKLAHTPDPPLHLPVGADAINSSEIYRERLVNDVNAWKEDSLSTGFM